MDKLTVVLPVRNEHMTIRENLDRIMGQLARDGIGALYLLVDDGSEDATWFEIRNLSEELPNVFGIRLSREFGRDQAIFAGLFHSSTPLCLVMNLDGSHPAGAVRGMLRMMDIAGAEVVEGFPAGRRKPGGVRGLLCGLTRSACGYDPFDSSDFRLVSRKAVNVLKHFDETTATFRGAVGWSGFPVFRYVWEPEEEGERDPEEPAAKPKPPGLRRYARVAATALFTYTSKPAWFILMLAAVCLAGVVAAAVYIFAMLFSGLDPGPLPVALLAVFAVGGLVLLAAGILGLYAARIYREVKRRPRHLIIDKTGGMYNKP